jgi:nitrile hydratase
MNGVHDMGGMHGFGPVVREENEPVFHEEWERRVFGMWIKEPEEIRPSGGGRDAIERMDPVEYLAASYYERWLAAIETGLLEAGVVTRDELVARTAFYRDNPDAKVPRREKSPPSEPATVTIPPSEAFDRLSEPAPRFKVGDRVRARNINPIGHTRLPRYARGRRGQIAQVYRAKKFPDTYRRGSPSETQAVYSVCFTGEELWGPSTEVGCEVYLDLWDSYLELDSDRE